jgi:sigma-B regulation protein RsbU (phosphoserine phosphatase)
MHTATVDTLRQQLDHRRARLREAIEDSGPEDTLVRLLGQVDAALGKLGTPEYGRCVVCDESVNEEDLLGNPVLRYCLCELTEAQQSALQRDLDLARTIQNSLLPDPTTRAAGWEAVFRYEPLGAVSGDFCDLWTRDDDAGWLFFAVGDVSGKGVAASLVMAHVQAAFRTLLAQELPLAGLVERVNDQLLRAKIASHYVTLACGRAHADGTVEIVNAGHCPPLVARSQDGVQRIASTGFPIGLFADRPYGVERVRLAPGDALVLYTDGLTEARANDGEEYGDERVASVLRDEQDRAPRSLVRAVRSDLGAFLGHAERVDDLTILALQRTAPAV